MEKSECKRMAQWLLSQLQGETLGYTDIIRSIREYLQVGGLTLADIGATEEMLEAARVRGCATYAKEWLRKPRAGSIMYCVHISSLRRSLQEGGLRPEDIGTSEEEIARFAQVSPETFSQWLTRRTVGHNVGLGST
jgi:hypothetical protein